MQNGAPAIPRLGIPEYNWWNEGLHGIARSGYATVFPQAIGMAASWDAELQQQIGGVVGTEARAKYNDAVRQGNRSIYFGLTVWSPNINIFRDPRWGRGQETYGEDPFLTARMGVAYVRGLQGGDSDRPMVIATPKHYAVHSGPEPLRHGFNVDASPKDLEETYLPAFRATVTEAQAGSVMCAYNAVDGEPACASRMLLGKTLREAWGFKGFVTSDCGAVGDISSPRGHHLAPDEAHASAAAVKAGTDTTCGREYVHLAEAVKGGLITEGEIDRAAVRLFTARYLLGMMGDDGGDVRAKVPMSEVDSASHRELALRSAREGIVLLKNDGVLPLKSGVKTVAVVGPNAAAIEALEGNYTGVPSKPVTPLDGLEAALRGRAKVVFAQGSPLVAELPVVAPRTLFRPAAGDAGFGLKGEYFGSKDFSGTPAVTRVDPQIDFDWNAAAPGAGLARDVYSVRWTGVIAAPSAGDVVFAVRTPHCSPCHDDEAVRVYLDGKQVTDLRIDKEGARGLSASPFAMHFADTKAHALKVEYVHTSPLFGGGVTLEWQPPVEALRAEAVAAARAADAVVAFVGLSPFLEGEEMRVDAAGFRGGDRTSLALPAAQEALLEAVAATGKPLVVVLMSGSAVASKWMSEHAAAVLEAWYPGESGGEALADVLTGRYSPAGRLPVTFYASAEQLPPFEEYGMKGRTYRYFEGEPAYGFGYGLSYTTFAYANRRLSAGTVQAGDVVTVSATVKNAGSKESDEVVEVYVSPGAAEANLPRRWLAGFRRVHLKAGEQREVSVALGPRELSTVGVDGTRAMAAGSYRVYVGGAQPGPGDPGMTLEIRGRQALPR
ncbi:MAG: glycoside hydrolase family 3 C-terminal domain-containing protein [Acidobacteriota bacterium]|nr:glycoside hydrolase family 3 C-terminal domain-containing protein [Acidobacteriota bacterium]